MSFPGPGDGPAPMSAAAQHKPAVARITHAFLPRDRIMVSSFVRASAGGDFPLGAHDGRRGWRARRSRFGLVRPTPLYLSKRESGGKDDTKFASLISTLCVGI